MPELPTGTVTFLFTDLEGSTRLWEQHPEAMREALARHDEILREAVEKRDGYVVKTTGDGLMAVFPVAASGVRAALEAQRALLAEPWPLPQALRVRMGLHTGAAEIRDNDYYGTAVNRAARISASAHGGQIVCSHATADLASDDLGSGAVLTDLGEHRLRDLGRPERMFQITAVGLDHAFPKLRTLTVDTNLPVQLTTFVGREQEVAALGAALADTRIVTLTGVGGVGKTRLAIQAAAESAPRYSDGVRLVELAPVSEAAVVPSAVAAALGTQAAVDMPIDDALVEDLRRRQLLLVLDNCEHLLDCVAHLVARILHECPGVVVLATSREGLALPGERIFPVTALAVPEPDATPEVARNTDAVRLFTDRATAVRSDFAITTENAKDVIAICRRLDGVPLALELAAARVTSLHPSQIAARLDERFRLLTAGRRTAVERHQTLRATIDWSYDLLTEDEQTALNRLAVFAGGCTLEAAESVVGGHDIDAWDVVNLLARLVEQSLVNADEAGSESRYGLLESIRQYAAERLAITEDTEATLDRHAAHYRALAQTIGLGLKGPDETAWLGRYETEVENLRSAVAWFAERDDADNALGLVLAMYPLKFNSTTQSIDDLADLALQTASGRSHPLGPSVMVLAAERLFNQGDDRAAHQLLDEAEQRQRSLGTAPHLVAPYVRFRIAMTDNDFVETAEMLREISSNAAVDKDDFAATWRLILRASQASLVGDMGLAEAAFIEAAELARRTGNPSCIVTAVGALGWVVRDRDPRPSLDLFDEAVAVGRGSGSFAFGSAIANRFIVHAMLGETGAALADGRATIEALDRTHERNWLSGTLLHSVIALAELHRWEAAAVLFGAAQTLAHYVAVPPESYGWRTREPRVRAALGDERYAASVELGRTMNKDAALDSFRAELDAIEAELADA